MTREEFIQATKTLKANGFESIGSVMCEIPTQCGVDYYNPITKEKFLLNKFTFTKLPQKGGVQ